MVLVYDVSDEKSFSDLQTEYDRCLDYVNKEDVFMVLVGNKSDLKSTPDYTEAGRVRLLLYSARCVAVLADERI